MWQLVILFVCVYEGIITVLWDLERISVEMTPYSPPEMILIIIIYEYSFIPFGVSEIKM
jgi:hypothetical protein